MAGVRSGCRASRWAREPRCELVLGDGWPEAQHLVEDRMGGGMEAMPGDSTVLVARVDKGYGFWECPGYPMLHPAVSNRSID